MGWPRRGGEGNFDKKKNIESMGCQEGGGKKMLKTQSLKARVAKKAGGGGEKLDKNNIHWKNGMPRRGENVDKKKIIESIGCQEGGRRENS